MSSPEEMLGRGRAGCWLFAIPIAAAIVVVAAYAVVLVAGVQGRPATGSRVRVEFTACPAAEPLIRERVDAMGLGDPVWESIGGGFALTATLPEDPGIAAEVPATLARPGRFTVRGPDGAEVVGHERVEGVMLQWGVLGDAKVQLALDAAGAASLRDWVLGHPGEKLVATIDDLALPLPGDALGRSPEKLALSPTRTEPRAAMAEIAAWALVVEYGPLPCAPVVTTHDVAPPAD
jgi:hypothetical protein